jgi:hypothetical protein
MSQDRQTYRLVAGDLAPFQSLLRFQGTFGQGIKQLSTADIGPYFDNLNDLSNAYNQIQNVQLKSWYDQLYSLLIKSPTVYQQDFPALYIVYAYSSFCKVGLWDGGTWKSFWNAFLLGYSWPNGQIKNPNWDPNNEWDHPPYNQIAAGTWGPWGSAGMFQLRTPPRPSIPLAWKQAIDDLLKAWGDNPPSKIIDKGVDIKNGDGAGAFEDNILKTWTDFPNVAVLTAPLWQSQHDTANALLQASSVDVSSYFLLLFLLIGLDTGSAKLQSYANQIVSAPADSQEYPNDIFINQQIYLILLYLADPMGEFAWTNAQLQNALNGIHGAIRSKSPASLAIKTSLENHLKVLVVDSAYPMQDPYSNIGFNQRQTDTLFALDKARAAVNKRAAS